MEISTAKNIGRIQSIKFALIGLAIAYLMLILLTRGEIIGLYLEVFIQVTFGVLITTIISGSVLGKRILIQGTSSRFLSIISLFFNLYSGVFLVCIGGVIEGWFEYSKFIPILIIMSFFAIIPNIILGVYLAKGIKNIGEQIE